MLSVRAMAMGGLALGGAAGAGLAGHRYAENRDDFDTADKLSFAGMSAATGGAAALALGYLGPRRMGQAAKLGMSGVRGVGKALAFNPIGKMMGRKGMGFGSIPKSVRGPLGAIAIAALAVGATAFSSHGTTASEDYGSRDGMGGTSYDSQPSRGSVRERAGLIGATGDMVFGLNNARHG